MSVLALLGAAAFASPPSAVVSITPHKNVFCHGELAKVSVSVNQVARVRLYTIADDRSTVQVWPARGESDRMGPETARELTVTMLQTEHGPERLVAVVIPPHADWAEPLMNHSCRVDGGWSASLVPPGASVAMHYYEVHAGTESCPQGGAHASAGTLARMYSELPTCG